MTFLGKYLRHASVSVQLYQKGVQYFIVTAFMCIMTSHRVDVTTDSFTSNIIKCVAPLNRGVKKNHTGEERDQNLLKECSINVLFEMSSESGVSSSSSGFNC